MSLDVYLTSVLFSANITHNLGKMAEEAGIYSHLWRPEGVVNCSTGRDLITPLASGLDLLLSDPDRFKKFNPENGYGDYDALVRFVEKYLGACRMYPDASVDVSR